ncbi:MAG: bifunctional folylpolyglutamate synthase/dihydrofolate synthase [Bryobacteraceae bacterium]
MSYPDSVHYLYALGNELKIGAKFGLERMQTLVAALGHPERGPRLVHVAGTNGKGSTCAMIANALRCGGLRTGLYTSPHLIEPTERIQVNGEPVSEACFTAAFETVHACAEKLLNQDLLDSHPSYFETVTAMALLIFREQCDVAVMEVGLGGRLDATNVILPELCVITPVSFDHEAFLGNTVESIAAEKAGILKPGVPVVLSTQHPSAERVIRARAEELKCPVIRAEDVPVAGLDVTAHDSTFAIDCESYTCALAGRHQVKNAVSAILACRRLGVDRPAIHAGLADVRWPGRLERVSQNPDFIIDGAHNPAGAAALASYIREFFAGRPVWVVYGAMRDKAIEEVAEQLFPLADQLILTAPNFSRALRPEAILEIFPHPGAAVTHSVAEAIALARGASADAAVFFCGSLYLAGEARELLLGRSLTLPAPIRHS